MDDFIPVNTIPPDSVTDIAIKLLEHLDSKTLLILGGMACFSTIICVACVSFSGSEMTISKNGLSIKQSVPTTA